MSACEPMQGSSDPRLAKLEFVRGKMIEVGTILVVPLITGFVEALKRAGLPSRYAALAALASGLAISIGAHAANTMGTNDLYDATLQGIAFGLASAGLYSVARSAERTARQRPLPTPPAPTDDPWRQP